MQVKKVDEGSPLAGSVQTDPTIPSESHAVDGLSLGAITPVEIPEEPVGSFSPEGEDTDFSNQVRPEIRKPEAFEKFAMCIRQIMEAVLLVRRVGVKGYDTQFCYVIPPLRAEISQGIKAVLVIPWWSFRDRRWYLWIVNANEDSSYFANLKPYLEQPEEFYRDISFTIETDKAEARYKFQKFKETRRYPGDPGRKTGVMLGQALGSRGVIKSADHPVFVELSGGEDIDL